MRIHTLKLVNTNHKVYLVTKNFFFKNKRKFQFHDVPRAVKVIETESEWWSPWGGGTGELGVIV